MVRSEIGILSVARHSNLVYLEDTFETATELFLVMELINGGELLTKINENGPFQEDVISIIVFFFLISF